MAAHAAPPPVPRKFDQLTTEWLSAALASRYPGVEVLSSRLDGKMGYKPNKQRIHLTYNDAAGRYGLPDTMIVKGGFQDEGNYGSGLDAGMQLEILGHRDAAPYYGINTAGIHYLHYDAEQAGAIMLMEDLAARRQARFFHVFTPLSVGQAIAFTDAIADYNAASWNSPDFHAGGRIGPDSEMGRIKGVIYDSYFARFTSDPDFFDAHIQLPRGAALPRLLRDRERLDRALTAFWGVAAAQPQCYIHGDEHLGNLFVEPDGKPGFLDYAGRPDSWNLGLAYFLIHALDVADRRAWEKMLLTRYLDRLRRNGIDAPAFEDAWFAYRCASVLMLGIWINNSPRWQPETINTANCVRAAAAVLDHDALALLG
ncbi:Phosphotransferase enzyme family protein [Sphingobium faniae]|nr:Phosphotransferase enzyme family protein [Sphingobium faniae]